MRQKTPERGKMRTVESYTDLAAYLGILIILEVTESRARLFTF